MSIFALKPEEYVSTDHITNSECPLGCPIIMLFCSRTPVAMFDTTNLIG